MITIISPAKNMKIRERKDVVLTDCRFPKKTTQVIAALKEKTPWELESLMNINEKLAGQAFQDIQAFDLAKKGTAAILTYDGLVFKHADAVNWSPEELAYAGEHLRILSACYGVLGALDEILPYRLEMQCKLKVDGDSLYDFWGNDICEEVYRGNAVVLNLASEEYAKCVRKYCRLGGSPYLSAAYGRFIDVEFLTYHKGKLKTLATLAKMARGHMVQYIVKNRIDAPEEVRRFDWGGYEYEPALSDENKYVFVAG